MNGNAFRPMRAAIALAALFFLSACGDYEIDLPGGYSLVRVSSGAALLKDKDENTTIGVNINAYAVLNGFLIVGQVVSAKNAPEHEVSVPGFFLVNTKNHRYRSGLDREAWLLAIAEEGRRRDFRIKSPSRFDKSY